jgi:hypothetical protein
LFRIRSSVGFDPGGKALPMSPRRSTPAWSPDLGAAPFAVPPEATPELVGAQIVSCFRAVTKLRRPATRVFEGYLAVARMDPRDPLLMAGATLAAEIDRVAAGRPPNAYHNSQHLCEVVLCSLFLGRQAGLSPPRLARVVVAALVHDFRHDGTTNGGEAFRLEQLAVNSARPFLVRASVEADEIERIAAIVLATEMTRGVPFARRCFRFLHQAGPNPEMLREATGDLSPLQRIATDPTTAFEAVLVAEADLLPSIALTEEHSLLCQQRLARENRHVAVGPAAKLAFLEQQAEGFLVSGFFEPNFHRLLQTMRAALSEGTPE